MEQFSFEATGTQWAILIDQSKGQSVFDDVKKCAVDFEERFSRFKDTSEIGRINNQIANTNNQGITNNQSLEIKKFEISDELAEMLVFGKQLQELTDGYFDVNVASILEGHGYDAQYSFQKNEDLLRSRRGDWKVDGSTLCTGGLVKLDLGAFGKGKLIDRIVAVLHIHKVENYLIDGGRDFYGTSKADGSAWRIALEHPFDAAMAIGEFPLKNCALACSGISQRKVKDFHHFIDTKTGKPVQEPVGVFVSAQKAMFADGVSTAMAVSPASYYDVLSSAYTYDFAVVSQSGDLIERGFDQYLY